MNTREHFFQGLPGASHVSRVDAGPDLYLLLVCGSFCLMFGLERRDVLSGQTAVAAVHVQALPPPPGVIDDSLMRDRSQ